MEAPRTWRRARGRPAGLLLALALTHLLSEAAVVRVFSQPGHQATLPCSYPYEDHSELSQLSVQWRSPDSQLLCHYIKHKGFQRCDEGYHMTYRPGSITLTIQRAQSRDFGPHMCSVSKRDEFLDYSVELVRATDSSLFMSPSPNRKQNLTGPSWTLAVVLGLIYIYICL